MSLTYIEDNDGNVVAQFDGLEVEPKDAHSLVVVDSHDDLPGVDDWDMSYRSDS